MKSLERTAAAEQSHNARPEQACPAAPPTNKERTRVSTPAAAGGAGSAVELGRVVENSPARSRLLSLLPIRTRSRRKNVGCNQRGPGLRWRIGIWSEQKTGRQDGFCRACSSWLFRMRSRSIQRAPGLRRTSYSAMLKTKVSQNITGCGRPSREDGLPYDFQSFRIFTYVVRRHRYETALIERNIEGYYPIEVTRGDDSPLFAYPA